MATAAVRPSLGPSRLLKSTPAASLSGHNLSITTRRFLQPPSSPSFSTTAPLSKRRRHKTRDNNRLRGVSSINRTGPREFLSVSNDPLPRPRAKPEDKGPVDPTHPLWEFFYEPGKQIIEPAEDAKHGRAWTAEELRRKSWEDLHRLWYKCVKEQNRIATAAFARMRAQVGFGDYEADARRQEVRKTMGGIKHVLTERYYAWEDAVELAKKDPEIDLSGDGPAYTPREYLEDEAFADEQFDAEPAVAGAASEQKAVDPAAIPGEAASGKNAEQTAPKK